MNMILFEGRKEDSYKKFQKSIDAERKMISTYMDDASAYDFIIDEPFMKETNYKYLNDFLEHFYTVNEYSGEAEPLTRDPARDMLFGIRNQIEKLIGFLEVYDKHKSKFKYPELRQYLPFLEEFVQEAKKIKDEVEAKQIEKSAKKEIDKIFENDTLLIVKPKSFVASCYYGSGTRWCTTMKGNPSYFNQYSSNGNLYYLILKNVDRSNKFYKMAINVPKNGKFDSDSIWYDSTDERLSSREKESVLAHMPKDAYNAMVNDYKTSFPKENVLDVIYKIIPMVSTSHNEIYPFKGGKLKFYIGRPSIEESDRDDTSVRVSMPWEIVEVDKEGKTSYSEDGVIDCYFEVYNAQVMSGKHIVRLDAEVIPYNTDQNIVKKSTYTKTLILDEDRQSDPEHVLRQTSNLLDNLNKEFYNTIYKNLLEDEFLSDRYQPTKSKAYTMSKYTFTGKGTLTKAFMEYLKNIPEGKVGNKNEFLTQIGRRTGPGQYSSFFSASNMAGISARQGKSGLVKGPNFDKFYKKIFE
jgi:hypothetical protein